MSENVGHGGSPSHAVSDYWWYVARSELLEASLGERATNGAAPRLGLDIGSADGPSAAWVHELAEHVVSLDIDPRGLTSGGVCGSALAVPFADETFDVVSAFDVLEHCDPEGEALAEIRRVLRPGGRLLMAVPAYQWAWSDHDVANGHHRRYTRARAVAAIERAGLVVDRATYAFASVFPLFAVERLVRRLVRRQRQTEDIVTIPIVPERINGLLTRVALLDAPLLRRHDLPFGSSVFLAAHRPVQTAGGSPQVAASSHQSGPDILGRDRKS